MNKQELNDLAVRALEEVLNDTKTIKYIMKVLSGKVSRYYEDNKPTKKLVGKYVFLAEKGQKGYTWMSSKDIREVLEASELPIATIGKELAREGGIRKYVKGIAHWRVMKIKKIKKKKVKEVIQKPVKPTIDAPYIVNKFIVLATEKDGQWMDVTASKIIEVMNLRNVTPRSMGIALSKAGALYTKKNNLSYFKIKKMKTKKYAKHFAG